jgi:predicted HTH transcriptional regulator
VRDTARLATVWPRQADQPKREYANSRDLAGLVQKGIIEQLGRTGKGTFYTLKTPKRR